MARYEVFIPARSGSDEESFTVQVEASSWLLALRSGMKLIGEQGEALSSIMVENNPDGTVIVKDPKSRRAFRIREVAGEAVDAAAEEARKKAEEEEARKAREAAELAARERTEAEKALQEKMEQQRLAELNARKEREVQEAQAKEQAAREAAKASMERAEAEKKLKAAQAKAAETQLKAAEAAEGQSSEISVVKTKVTSEQIAQEMGSLEMGEDPFDVDDVMSDLFMETMDIPEMDEQEAIEYIMDLSMNTIQAEAGSVILSDINSALSDLYFAAARGEAASKLEDIRIPRGKGVVGFSVQVGCPLAVNDVDKNPNFYRAVADKTGFITKSILCVPIISSERTFGALELINKTGGSDRWSAGEMNVLDFLAQKLAERLQRAHDEVKLDLK